MNHAMENQRCDISLAMLLWIAFLLGACDEKAAIPEGYQGIVELDERMLAFEVGGRLLEVAVRRGDTVAPGVLLARLDSTLPTLELQALEAQSAAVKAELDLLYEGTRPEVIQQARARLKAADATLRSSEREFERVQTMYQSNTATEQSLDLKRATLAQARAAQAEAEQLLKELRRGPRAQEIEAGEARLEAAKSSAESAKERIRRHELFADGRAEVLDVPRKFGEYVSPGTTVVTVADTTRPYVDIFVPQQEASRISLGAPVTVRVDALDTPLGGRVEHISRAMEYSPRFLFSPAERPYLVLRARIRIRDDGRRIRAGVPTFVTPGANGLLLPEAPETVSLDTPQSRKSEDTAKTQRETPPAKADAK